MEKKCRDCARICKWLEYPEVPKFYSFRSLSPSQILELLEKTFQTHNFRALTIEELAHSYGDQLAVLLIPNLAGLNDGIITLIAQCETTSEGTNMWFRFGVEDSLCGCAVIMDEFHEFLNNAIETLFASDLLSSNMS